MISPTGVEHAPHFGGSVWLFWTCRPCLAPARLRPPHPKSRKHFSPKCAKQFCRSGFLSRREIGRREYLAYCQGQLRSMGGNPPGKTVIHRPPTYCPNIRVSYLWRLIQKIRYRLVLNEVFAILGCRVIAILLNSITLTIANCQKRPIIAARSIGILI